MAWLSPGFGHKLGTAMPSLDLDEAGTWWVWGQMPQEEKVPFPAQRHHGGWDRKAGAVLDNRQLQQPSCRKADQEESQCLPNCSQT